MRIYLRSECVVYEAILEQARKVWEDGRLPASVRMSAATVRRFTSEFNDRLHIGKTSYGALITAIHTEYGPIQVMVDPHMPDDAFILQVRFQPRQNPYWVGSEDAEST